MAARPLAEGNPRAVLWGTLAVLALSAVPLAFKPKPLDRETSLTRSLVMPREVGSAAWLPPSPSPASSNWFSSLFLSYLLSARPAIDRSRLRRKKRARIVCSSKIRRSSKNNSKKNRSSKPKFASKFYIFLYSKISI